MTEFIFDFIGRGEKDIPVLLKALASLSSISANTRPKPSRTGIADSGLHGPEPDDWPRPELKIEKDDLDAWSDRWVDMRERIIIEDTIREAARAGRKIRVTIEEIISCPKCGASATKFGKPAGRQRYRCMAHGCHHIFMEQR